MALDASRRILDEDLHVDGDGGRIAEQLFHEHSARIYAYCRAQLASPDDAEDAVQATFLSACRSLNAGFRPRVPIAWLMWIAANVCRKRHRSRFRLRRREWLGDPDALAEMLPAPENGHEELLGLSQALKSLSERQRRALVRREWQGLSYDEIAAELGTSHSAVETLLFRARRSLKSALDARAGDRDGRRLRSFDLASLGAGLKSLLAGGTAGKVAVAVGAAVVATTTTVALTPLDGGLDGASESALAGSPREQVSARPFASEVVTAPWSRPATERKSAKPLRSSKETRVAPALRPPRDGNPSASSLPLAAAADSAPASSTAEVPAHDSGAPASASVPSDSPSMSAPPLSDPAPPAAAEEQDDEGEAEETRDGGGKKDKAKKEKVEKDKPKEDKEKVKGKEADEVEDEEVEDEEVEASADAEGGSD